MYRFLRENCLLVVSLRHRPGTFKWVLVSLHQRFVRGVALHCAGACGGFLRTGEAPLFLFSPGWPDSYGNRADCMWLIQAPESTVELNILSMDIEAHRTCNYDKLVIRDGEKHSKTNKISFRPGPYLVTFHYNHACWLPSSILHGISRLSLSKQASNTRIGYHFWRMWGNYEIACSEITHILCQGQHLIPRRKHYCWRK